MTYIALTWWDLAAASLLIFLNGALSVAFRLGFERSLAASVARMVIQLTAIGFVLKFIFAQTSALWTLGLALIMGLGTIDAALDLVPDMEQERSHVAALAQQFRSQLQAAGFDIGMSRTQICPLIVGASETALALAEALRAKGIWCTPIRPPTVPEGAAWI